MEDFQYSEILGEPLSIWLYNFFTKASSYILLFDKFRKLYIYQVFKKYPHKLNIVTYGTDLDLKASLPMTAARSPAFTTGSQTQSCIDIEKIPMDPDFWGTAHL